MLMKQYVIDQLRPEDFRKLKAHLDRTSGCRVIENIYWLDLPVEHYAARQLAHTACQPFYLALELQPHQLSAELLVRSRNRMRCDCISYATHTQRHWMIDTIDAMLANLDIHV